MFHESKSVSPSVHQVKDASRWCHHYLMTKDGFPDLRHVEWSWLVKQAVGTFSLVLTCESWATDVGERVDNCPCFTCPHRDRLLQLSGAGTHVYKHHLHQVDPHKRMVINV